MADRYGDSYSGIRFNRQTGGLETVATLKYGAEGEDAIRNLRRGAEVRAARAKASAVKSRTYYGNGNGGDGLPVTNLSRRGCAVAEDGKTNEPLPPPPSDMDAALEQSLLACRSI